MPLAAAALLAVVALGALFLRDGDPDPQLVALGRVTPADLPDHVPMPIRNGRPDGDAVERGLAAYHRGDYAAAAEILGPIDAADTPPAVRLYTGASLLALEQPDAAIAHLRAARAQPLLAHPADFLLAKASLQQGEADAALGALRPLADGTREWSSPARDLVCRVERVEGSEH